MFDIVLIGTGSLAEALLMSLVVSPGASGRLLVVGRNAESLQELKTVAQIRGKLVGSAWTVSTASCELQEDALKALFARLNCRVVVMAASLQSPWQMGPNWRALVQHHGYGLTLPLQAQLAKHVALAHKASSNVGHLVNACYPDVVNPVLSQLGLPVLCGIGNVAILAAMLQLKHPGREIQLFAHHGHIDSVIKNRLQHLAVPMALWMDGQALGPQQTLERLADITLPASARINLITGAISSGLVLALAGLRPYWTGHAPGVLGQQGGYPVDVDARGVRLHLPAGCKLEDMVGLNRDAGVLDGVQLSESGLVRLVARTQQPAQRRSDGLAVLPGALQSWRVSDLDAVANEMQMYRRAID